MLDINTAMLIVLLNDPQAGMGALGPQPMVWGRWRHGAVVIALVGILVLALY